MRKKNRDFLIKLENRLSSLEERHETLRKRFNNAPRYEIEKTPNGWWWSVSKYEWYGGYDEWFSIAHGEEKTYSKARRAVLDAMVAAVPTKAPNCTAMVTNK